MLAMIVDVVAVVVLLSALALAARSVCCFCLERRRFDKLPRGPPRIPVLGNIFMLRRGATIFESLEACKSRYGNLFTVYTGSVPSVVLSGYDLVREALLKKGRWFEERTDSLVVPPNQKGGILWAPSPVWREQRAFAIGLMKLMTTDVWRLESIILREAESFIELLGSKFVEHLDLALQLHRRVARVTSVIVFGDKLPCDEAVFNELVDHFHENTESLPRTVLSKTVPLLEYLPWDPFKLRQTRKNNERIRKLLAEIVANRKQALLLDSESMNPSAFLDHYIFQISHANAAMRDEPSEHSFTDDNCINCISQLLAAGTETTATVLRWAFLYVAIQPDVQHRLQDEIDCVIGRDGRASWHEHGQSMPYTRATLAEAMRIGCVVPLALPHRTSGEGVAVAGHWLPGSTEVLVDLHSILLDETAYARPYSFEPSRFLDESGAYRKPESFIPFGIGKRMCIGESLAKAEMFLFFVALLRRFSLSSPDGAGAAASARYKATIGITRQPPQYSLVAEERR